MQSEPWTRKQCDNRLRSDMTASCKSDPLCLATVFPLYIIDTIRSYPTTAKPFCSNKCITPLGNPTAPIDLS